MVPEHSTQPASPASTRNQATALITGAAKRIGRVIALELARQGWDIAIHFHTSQEGAESLAREISALGQRSILLQADLADHSALAPMVENCAKDLSPPLCLINNVSRFDHDTAQNMSCKSWDTHFDINLRAPLFLAQAFAEIKPQQREGNIINIIDQRVWRPGPEFFSYTLSKSALLTATQIMAQSFAPHIRVNAIGPGPTLRNIYQSEAEFEAERQSTLLRRGTSPEEIARAVQFILASPAMTGQMMALDGGQHLSQNTPQSAPQTELESTLENTLENVLENTSETTPLSSANQSHNNSERSS